MNRNAPEAAYPALEFAIPNCKNAAQAAEAEPRCGSSPATAETRQARLLRRLAAREQVGDAGAKEAVGPFLLFKHKSVEASAAINGVGLSVTSTREGKLSFAALQNRAASRVLV